MHMLLLTGSIPATWLVRRGGNLIIIGYLYCLPKHGWMKHIDHVSYFYWGKVISQFIDTTPTSTESRMLQWRYIGYKKKNPQIISRRKGATCHLTSCRCIICGGFRGICWRWRIWDWFTVDHHQSDQVHHSTAAAALPRCHITLAYQLNLFTLNRHQENNENYD